MLKIQTPCLTFCVSLKRFGSGLAKGYWLDYFGITCDLARHPMRRRTKVIIIDQRSQSYPAMGVAVREVDIDSNVGVLVIFLKKTLWGDLTSHHPPTIYHTIEILIGSDRVRTMGEALRLTQVFVV